MTDTLPVAGVTTDPEVLSGKPVISGTRIQVSLLLNLMANGYDFQRIIDGYPELTEADLVAALLYAADRLDRQEDRLLHRAR